MNHPGNTRTLPLGDNSGTMVMSVCQKRQSRVKVMSPADVYNALRLLRNKRCEHFLVLTLSSVHEVIGVRLVTIGLLNSSLVHPREVFWWAIHDNAESVIVAHNHPSGNCEPSTEDSQTTVRLREAGKLMGIEVLDHVIISSKGFYSCKEHGM